MDRNQLIHQIGSKLVQDIGGRKKDWDRFAIVGEIEQDQTSMAGFWYDKHGEHEAVAPKDFTVLDDLAELRNAMAHVDRKPPWVACLIQVVRASGSIDFQFEYENAKRWAITFKNGDERAKEIRPDKD